MIRKLTITCIALLCTTWTIFAQCDLPAPAGPDCGSATFFCNGEVDGFCSTLPPNGNPNGPSPLCNGVGVPNNTEWIAFAAGSTNITIQIIPSNCDTVINGGNPNTGVQAGIYSDCSFTNAITCQGACQTNAFTLSGTFVIGQVYYIFIDGCGGSVCDYQIVVTGGSTVSPPPGMATGPTGLTSPCPGANPAYNTFTIPPVLFANLYDWTITPASVIFSQSGNTITVLDWGGATSATICVEASNDCNPGPAGNQVCTTFSITPVMPIDPPPGIYCEGTGGYVYPDNGQNYFAAGSPYSVTLTSPQGCDSIVMLEVIENPITSEQIEATVCQGDCIIIDGQPYCTTVSGIQIPVSTPNEFGCDSTVFLDLEVLNPMVSIGGLLNLSCNATETVLFANASNSPNPTYVWSYLWSTPNGSVANGIFDSSILLVDGPGDYTVEVTLETPGGVMCTAISIPVTVTADADPPTTSTSTTEAPCSGAPIGTATVVASGGGGSPYTYMWDPATGNQTTATATALANGLYYVTVTSSNGCTALDSALVSSSAAVVLTVDNVTSISCNGDNTGSASVSGSGGTPGYTYLWNSVPAQMTPTASGLIAGSYMVTVTDDAGCTDVETIVISEPPALTSTATALPASCDGSDSGMAYVTPGGGVPGYTYLWDSNTSSQTTDTAFNLVAGLYDVTITDANMCTQVITNINVTEPSPISVSSTEVDALCNGGTGSATAMPSGGTPGYTYSWNSVPAQSTVTATSLPAGTYSVTVTDLNGCTEVLSGIVIDEPDAMTGTALVADAGCNGTATGSIDVTATGTGTLSYSWSANASTGNVAIANNLAAGTYSVTITDGNNCTFEINGIIVGEPVAVTASISASQDILCFGESTGNVTAQGGGGDGTYTYLWSPSAGGAITQTVNALPAGTYIVTVTDGAGCTEETSITLTEPAAALDIMEVAVVDASCTSNDGSIDIAISGGTSGYTYLWAPGGYVVEDPQNLAGGSYTVTVTDANMCTAEFTTTVNIPGGLTATAAATALSCNGDTNADIDVTVTGGTGTLVYTWSNLSFGDVQDVSNVGPGTYSVTITDANSCSVQTGVTITEPDSISISSVQVSQASCGLSDGSIDLFITGGTGTGTYSFLWTGGADPVANPQNLAAGPYTVMITDGNGCLKDTTITITSPDGPVLDAINAVDVLCFGDPSGAINVDFSGGQGPFVFDWTGTAFDGIEDPTSVPAGIYDVTITDANNCSTISNVVVGEPTQLTGSTMTTDVLCSGENTGTATAIPAGGTSGYTYLWCDGQTTDVATNLPQGACGVTVTDVNGCELELGVMINEPPALTASVTTVTPADCNGTATGSIDLNVGGGAGTYTYSWTNAADPVANPQNLAAGTYEVTVMDANGCSQILSGIVVQEPSPITLTYTFVDPDCAMDNGSINVIPAGGNGGYSYAWTGGNGPAPVFNPTGLAAGTYNLIITDDKGCTKDTTVTLTTPNGPTLSTITAVDVNCFGESNGSINIDFSGGQGPYVFDWTGTAYDGIEDPTNVPAGVYDLTITDDNNCSAISSITVNEPTELTTTTSTTDVLCNGENSGTATAIPAGGTAGYTYLWCDGQTTDVAINLPQGACGVTITDANGCELESSVMINEPPVLTAAVSTINAATCNGTATGSIELNVGGGMGTYTYAWSGGADPVFNPQNLAADTYSVTVTDANGCFQVIAGIEITEPDAITFTATTEDATCNQDNGSIELMTSGGNGGYTYLWSGGADPVANPQNLLAGAYDVTITDMLGCTTIGSVTVATPSALVVQAVQTTDANCFGNADGAIQVAVTGGSPGYTYAWSGGLDPVPNPSNVPAGTYNLDITDTDGCVISTSATVGEPDEIVITIVSVVGATCNDNNGSVDIEVAGGTLPYTYLWSSGDTGQDPMNLPAGLTDVVITDGNGCTSMAQVSVSTPGALNVIPSATGVSCFSATDGTITLNATGGNGPYTYIWSIPGVGDTNIATDLGGGTYSVIVRDADGCIFPVASILVDEPASLVQDGFMETDASCDANDGSIEVSFTGGTGSYTYSWTSPTGPFTSTQEDIFNLIPGEYILVVTDENDCTTSVQGIIDVPTPPTASATADPVRCFGEANGSINVLVNGANGAVTYLWDDATIGDIPNPTGLLAGTYEVTVTDAENCEVITSVMVTEPPVLDALTLNATEVSCNGGDDGSATVTVMGGTPGYNYLWSNGAMVADPTDLVPGTYTVVVTDANGCTDTETAEITEPPALVLDAEATDTRCSNEENGTINLMATGGDGTYSYDWDIDQYDGLNQLSDLPAGVYTVIVTDGKGCTETIFSEVMAPPAVIVRIEEISDYAGYNVSCANLSDGSATVQGTGGNGAPFTFLWGDGTTTGTIEGLSAGDYTVTVTDMLGCTEEELISLISPDSIDLFIEGASVSCYGDDNGAVLINDVQGGSEPYLFSIDGSAFGQGFFTGLAAGNYEIVVQDANGCEEKEVVTVQEPTELVADLAIVDGDAEIQLGDSIFLQTIVPGSVLDTFYWVQGIDDLNCDTCFGQWVTPLNTTTYSIFVRDENGCTDVDEVQIRVKKDRLIYIPTAFSPVATGANNIFTIYGGTGVERVNSFIIADRWGEVVFSDAGFFPNDPSHGWDGTLKGEPLNPAVFVYFAEILFTDGRVEVYKGDVTLIR